MTSKCMLTRFECQGRSLITKADKYEEDTLPQNPFQQCPDEFKPTTRLLPENWGTAGERTAVNCRLEKSTQKKIVDPHQSQH